MIYIVECALNDEQTDEQWLEWYHSMKPPSHFLSPEGWHTVQRFKGVSLMPPAYFGLYNFPSVDFLTSDRYRSRGGGRFVTDRWKSLITFWHRDLFEGDAPAVPEKSLLAVIDAGEPRPMPRDVKVVWAKCAGLDRTTPYRGFAVLESTDVERWRQPDLAEFRIFKPMMRQLTLADASTAHA